MEERTTGLILRTRPLTETSLIVNWLTPDAGRISTVAKGARRPKSGFRGKLDLFFLAEFSFSRSRRSDLHNLREIRLVVTHARLRTDLDLVQQAAYSTAFVEKCTESETPLPEVYEILVRFLEHLATTPWRAESVIWFELRMLQELGLQPEARTAGVSPRTRSLLESVLSEATGPAELQMDPGHLKELIHFLHGFMLYHLDRLPPGRAAALRHVE